MNIDYTTLEEDILSGSFRTKLELELVPGFRDIHRSGERLPPPSHLASQIAEIVDREVVLRDELKYELYQEILAACEHARAEVLGESTNIAP